MQGDTARLLHFFNTLNLKQYGTMLGAVNGSFSDIVGAVTTGAAEEKFERCAESLGPSQPE